MKIIVIIHVWFLVKVKITDCTFCNILLEGPIHTYWLSLVIRFIRSKVLHA